MSSPTAGLENRIVSLERALRRERRVAAVVLVGLLTLGTVGAQKAGKEVHERLYARHIVVLDEHDRPRITLGEDPADTQRRSRSCGINLYDTEGAERFGVGTMEDMSVTLGIDAPEGVGSPMRDRIGLVVGPDGAARIDLINNQTLLPVRLVSEAAGDGGVEFFDYDLEHRKVTVTRWNARGETKRELPLGDGK